MSSSEFYMFGRPDAQSQAVVMFLATRMQAQSEAIQRAQRAVVGDLVAQTEAIRRAVVGNVAAQTEAIRRAVVGDLAAQTEAIRRAVVGNVAAQTEAIRRAVGGDLAAQMQARTEAIQRALAMNFGLHPRAIAQTHAETVSRMQTESVAREDEIPSEVLILLQQIHNFLVEQSLHGTKMQQYAQVSIILSAISILLRLGLVDGILWILGILHGAGLLMPSASIGLVHVGVSL